MSQLRNCYAVSYKDPNTDIEFGSYILAIDAEDLKLQISKYVNNVIITGIVSGAEGPFITGYDCVMTSPMHEFENMQKEMVVSDESKFHRDSDEFNDKRLDIYFRKLTHTVVFLISRINAKGLPIADFLTDNGLLHELIHVITGTTGVFRFFQDENIKSQLLEIEKLLPELFLTDEELDLVKQINGKLKCQH